MTFIRPRKLSELVADDLREKIIQGVLREGDSVAPESALMDQYRVSRPAVREALRLLEHECLISLQQGDRSGARVRAPRGEAIARAAALLLQYDRTPLADVLDAKSYLEIAAVRHLAARAGPDVIKRLSRSTAPRSPDSVPPPIEQFELHSLIVQLTGNETLSILHSLTHDIVNAAVARLSVIPAEVPPPVRRKSQHDHERLVELIADGRIDDADRLWRQHSIESARVVLKLFGERTLVEIPDPLDGSNAGHARAGGRNSGVKSAELIAASLSSRIVRREFDAGSQLPSEADLIATFEVSRPTLRAAVRLAESEGLIELRRGANGGAFAVAPSRQLVSRRISLLLQYRQTRLSDLLAARIEIEAPAARMLAAKIGGNDDYPTSLAAALQRGEPRVQEGGALLSGPFDFHHVLVSLSGSRTLSLFDQATSDILVGAHQSMRRLNERAARNRRIRNSRLGHRAHQRAVDIILSGDAGAAEAFWRYHLQAANEVVLKEIGDLPIGELLSPNGIELQRLRTSQDVAMCDGL